MLAHELISNDVPGVELTDSVSKALRLMKELKTTHLPVVANEKYLGLISEDDLMEKAEPGSQLLLFQNDFINAFVSSDKHFLNAVTVTNHYQTNVVPVVNESNEFLGTIGSFRLLSALGNFSGADETGAIIVLEMERSKFSISEISRIVESDGSVILHLNVTMKPGSSIIQVTIHLNKKEIAVIVAAFERYDYTLSYYSGEELFENEIELNYKNLMNYLDI